MGNTILLKGETKHKVMGVLNNMPSTDEGQTKVDNILIQWGARGISLTEVDPIMDSGVGVIHKDRKAEREKEEKGGE